MPRDVMDFDARKKPAWFGPADDSSRLVRSRPVGQALPKECSKRG